MKQETKFVAVLFLALIALIGCLGIVGAKLIKEGMEGIQNLETWINVSEPNNVETNETEPTIWDLKYGGEKDWNKDLSR